MTRSAADGGIERVDPLNRIGQDMKPVAFVMICLLRESGLGATAFGKAARRAAAG